MGKSQFLIAFKPFKWGYLTGRPRQADNQDWANARVDDAAPRKAVIHNSVGRFVFFDDKKQAFPGGTRLKWAWLNIDAKVTMESRQRREIFFQIIHLETG